MNSQESESIMTSVAKAIILAGGLGTRLRPLTDTLPKCLVPIAGRPLLDYWVDALVEAGVREARVNNHAHADQVRAYVNAVSSSGRLKLEEFYEPTLLGSAGTIAANADLADGASEVIIIYADNFSDADLKAMLAFHRSHDDPFTMLLFRASNPRACGIAELDGAGRVVSFVEKPQEPTSDLANGGVYIVDASAYQEIADMKAFDLGFEVLPRFVGRMRGWAWEGYHLDVGTHEALEKARRDAPSLIPSEYTQSQSGVAAVSGGATRTPHPNPPPQGGRGPEKDSITLASDSLPPCGGGSGWGGEDIAPPENSGTCNQSLLPRPAVFLDRDGTVIEHVHYIGDPTQVRLLPEVVPALRRLQAAGFALVVVTNQSAIGRGYITVEQYEAVNVEMVRQLAVEGVTLDAVYYCPEAPKGDDRAIVTHEDRKPGPGMLRKGARDHHLDLSNSWMIGDMISDALAGINAGCRGTFLVETGKELLEDEASAVPGLVVVPHLSAAADVILDAIVESPSFERF
jgi:mannose-1-phosphate guanylyltransferase